MPSEPEGLCRLAHSYAKYPGGRRPCLSSRRAARVVPPHRTGTARARARRAGDNVPSAARRYAPPALQRAVTLTGTVALKRLSAAGR